MMKNTKLKLNASERAQLFMNFGKLAHHFKELREANGTESFYHKDLAFRMEQLLREITKAVAVEIKPF